MKVRTLGLMRDRASQRTMVSSRTPQARPKAEVQEALIGVAPIQTHTTQNHLPQRRLRRRGQTFLGCFFPRMVLPSCSWIRVVRYASASFGASPLISSWMVLSFRISRVRLPLGVTTTASSPTFLLRSARPIGLVVEILPVATSDSSLVTSLYSISSSLVLSYTLMVEPSPTLSWGMLFMLTMDRSARRLPSWRTRALTNSWRCLAMWYSAFSLRSPRAAAFLISFGSSWINSCSSALISSCSFRLI